MNISGLAVELSLRKHIRPPSSSHLIVVHDSLSHRPLSASPKAGGSAEGHNGVRSIIQALGGNANFRRIRVGIGKGSGDVAAYVLGRLSAEERGFWTVEGLDLVWRQIETMVANSSG
jgi:PTH1 family peptidyl-tRNA hydrolase